MSTDLDALDGSVRRYACHGYCCGCVCDRCSRRAENIATPATAAAAEIYQSMPRDFDGREMVSASAVDVKDLGTNSRVDPVYAAGSRSKTRLFHRPLVLPDDPNAPRAPRPLVLREPGQRTPPVPVLRPKLGEKLPPQYGQARQVGGRRFAPTAIGPALKPKRARRPHRAGGRPREGTDNVAEATVLLERYSELPIDRLKWSLRRGRKSREMREVYVVLHGAVTDIRRDKLATPDALQAALGCGENAFFDLYPTPYKRAH